MFKCMKEGGERASDLQSSILFLGLIPVLPPCFYGLCVGWLVIHGLAGCINSRVRHFTWALLHKCMWFHMGFACCINFWVCLFQVAKPLVVIWRTLEKFRKVEMWFWYNVCLCYLTATLSFLCSPFTSHLNSQTWEEEEEYTETHQLLTSTSWS